VTERDAAGFARGGARAPPRGRHDAWAPAARAADAGGGGAEDADAGAGGAAGGAAADAAFLALRLGAASLGAHAAPRAAPRAAPHAAPRAAPRFESVWIDTVPALARAAAGLRAAAGASGGLAVDAHGVRVGREGSVSVLSLCAAPRGVVHFVDVAALGAAAFAPAAGLRALLADAALPKLFFDVRADANALFFHYGLALPPAAVTDLQVLDAAAAAADAARAGRPPPSHLRGAGAAVARAPTLDAPTRAAAAAAREAALSVYAQERGGSYAPWVERPLPAVLAEHAADVRFFHELAGSLRAAAARGAAPPAALAAAVAARVAAAHTAAWSCSDGGNARVDAALAAALAGRAPAAGAAAAAAAAAPPFDGGGECVVCLSGENTHAFVPCGHKCVCRECAAGAGGFAACPVCRGPAERVVRIF